MYVSAGQLPSQWVQAARDCGVVDEGQEEAMERLGGGGGSAKAAVMVARPFCLLPRYDWLASWPAGQSATGPQI